MVAVLLFALAGCGGGGDDAEEQGTTAGAEAQANQVPSSGQAKTPNAAEAAQETSSSAIPQGNSASGGEKKAPPIAIPTGPRERGPTPQERAEATVASMSLSSPVLEPGPESKLLLPPTYTCDGADTSPPLRWSGTPAGTEELILFAMNLVPVEEKLFFGWAVAGIDPKLTSLEAGELPKGAVLGRNGFGQAGYSICPQGKSETYLFALFALPQSLNAKRGFDPLALREEVLGVSGDVGLLAPTYARG